MRPTTFARAGDDATADLVRTFYAGNGLWRFCDEPTCGKWNYDWGADALTYALYLRWSSTHDRGIATIARDLIRTAPQYGAPCAARPCGWSDVPAWDAIALVREWEITRDTRALAKAKAAFAYVEDAKVFARGACPEIRYQQPEGEANRLKTLETDANMIKAALLLYRATRDDVYLASARRTYDAVRSRFLEPDAPLYTVYVFDDGTRCTRVPHRFFASVNGDMIWSGLELARVTGDLAFRAQALATARAVDARLSDPSGIFENLQAENDIAEPLVEAMYALARNGHAHFARAWVVRNAAAALRTRARGSFGRFFGGPAPRVPTTAWQANGGYALAVAAAALAPRTRVSLVDPWRRAKTVVRQLGVGDAVTFRGRGIALYGTLGERCCENGHARVLVDGVETFDRTGVWQNKSSSGRSVPGTVLFAWRWPRPGTHTVSFAPAEANAKEGASYLHLSGYRVLR